MDNSRTKKHGLEAGAAPPFEWLERQLAHRAGEVKFLREQIFPNPVRAWDPARLMDGPLSAKEVITVPIFGEERTTCSIYVTQSFRLIGEKLFAGLQPDQSCFPDGKSMRLCLCVAPEEEIETPIVLTDAGEFQLIVNIEPEMVAAWAKSSKDWATNPQSIPFGLVLRPVRAKNNA